MDKMHFSRRNFLKTGTLSWAALAGASTLASCSKSPGADKREPFPLFKSANYSPEDGISSLLFSQLGYETGLPVRVIVRLPKKDPLSETACRYCGVIWESHWWIARFPAFEEEGEWDIQIQDGAETVFTDYGLRVKKNIFWDSTIEWSSVDMLKRRRSFPGVWLYRQA